MQQNVGSIDKVIRVAIGVVLLGLVFFLKGSVRWLGLIGLAPIFTAFIGWCPAYSLFHLNTSSKKR